MDEKPVLSIREFGVVKSGELVRSSYHADEQSTKYMGHEHLNTANTLANA